MSESNKRFGNGSLLSIIAIIISLSALGVSVFEVTSLKDQQKASVWPYLEVSSTYSGEGFKVTLTNKGIGPALLGDVVLTHNGKDITSTDELDALIVESIGAERAFSYDTYRARNPSSSVLAPGEEVVLFGVPWTADTRAFIQAVGQATTANGCYCSVYDDCWNVGGENLPEPTRECR